MQRYKVGIIGYGDFTKLMCEYLAPYADIVVSSRRHLDGDAGHGARFAPLHDVLTQDIVIPSFPSQHFADFFEVHGKTIREDAIVIDVCSVKTHPLDVLARTLSEKTRIIGTHPMFGPASVGQNGGIKNLKCVVSPVRVDDATLATFESFLADTLGLQVLRRTPEQHDREMAYVQGLSHYIARLMDTMNIPESDLATLAYDDLIAMKHIQAQDSWELFASIMNDNPYAFEVNTAFKRAITELDKKIAADS